MNLLLAVSINPNFSPSKFHYFLVASEPDFGFKTHFLINISTMADSYHKKMMSLVGKPSAGSIYHLDDPVLSSRYTKMSAAIFGGFGILWATIYGYKTLKKRQIANKKVEADAAN